MPLKYNGVTPTTIYYGNTALTKVIYGTTVVWEKPLSGNWTASTPSTRPWTGNTYDYALSGTSMGDRSGGTYTYKVTLPVYHSSSNTTSYTARVYLAASSGGTTIDLGTQAFTKSGTYNKTVTSSTWLGNRATIYCRIVFSNGGYMTVNSGGTITATISSTADG